jgi:hypothetical protein
MVRGYVLIEVEGVKQSVLIAAVLSNHAGAPFTAPTFQTSKSHHCSIVFQRNRS